MARIPSSKAGALGDLHETLAAWALGRPSVMALHIFGSRARGDARPDSDLDLAFDLMPADGEDLAELIMSSAKWEAELSALTGLLVRDLHLRADPVVSGPVITVFRR